MDSCFPFIMRLIAYQFQMWNLTIPKLLITLYWIKLFKIKRRRNNIRMLWKVFVINSFVVFAWRTTMKSSFQMLRMIVNGFVLTARDCVFAQDALDKNSWQGWEDNLYLLILKTYKKIRNKHRRFLINYIWEITSWTIE